jgi:chemotaxis protein methyltransferase CheR
MNNYLNDEDFSRFNLLLLGRVGLNFSEMRRGELESAVMQSFAASTFSRLDDYYAALEDQTDGGIELERLINFATVNETHFFRDAGQFDALATHILPELIKRRQSMRTLRLWSAGCASGEEPYSLAILLHELLPNPDEWSISILATDVNTIALDRARKAVYNSWSFREDKAQPFRDKYFSPVGNSWELNPKIRRMVTFTRMNLAAQNYPSYETNTTFMDLIVCRNVLIYLGETVIRHMIGQFFECIQPGGWLVVAPAEGSPELFKQFKSYSFPSAILYQRMTQTAVLRQKTLRNRTPDSTTAHLRTPASANSVTTPIQAKRQVALPELSPAEEQNMFEQAQELVSYGMAEKALDILQKLVNAKFNRDKVFALTGKIYANRGDWDQAENWCTQSIYLNRLSLDAYYTLALVLQHKGQWEHAVEAMRKVIYIDHTDVLGHFGLANLYFENGRLPKAIKSLDNALHLLDHLSPEEVVSRSDGVTVDRLRMAITRQQQLWNGLISDPSFSA